MGSLLTSNLRVLTLLLLWIASYGLSTSVNHAAGTDGTPGFAKNITTATAPLGSAPFTSSPMVETPGNVTRVPEKNEKNASLPGEGGPISIASTTQQSFSTATHSTTVSNESSAERTVQRKPISSQAKIVPRKGANQPDMPVEFTSSSTTKNILSDVKPVFEQTTETDLNNNNTRLNTNSTSFPMLPVTGSVSSQNHNATVKHINETLTNNTKTLPEANVGEQKAVNNNATVKAITSPKKHKPKPTATIVNSRTDDEKPMPAMPTRTSPLGMPRKIDYIVPVIITIVALPLLGAATFMVYRRGRDCWDKRHYRRMDFLIDGMYND